MVVLKKSKAKKPKKTQNTVTHAVRRVEIEEVNAELRKLLQRMIDIIDNDPLADFEPIMRQWEGSYGRRPPNGKGEIVIYTGLVKDENGYRMAKENEMEECPP